jgi:hypothetical protein
VYRISEHSDFGAKFNRLLASTFNGWVVINRRVVIRS